MVKTVAVNPIYRDKKSRAWELDFLRGVAVLCMCFDHLMYDFAYCKNWFEGARLANGFIDAVSAFAKDFYASYYTYGFRFWAHNIFVFLFLFLVGVSCSFSRDNIKRGSLLAVVSVAFTGVTYLMKSFMQPIVFGVLHCIALSILCVAAVDIATKKIKWLNTYLPLVLGVIILAFAIYSGSKYNLPYLPRYKNSDAEFQAAHLLEYILGVDSADVLSIGATYGSDWFGLFPNVGMVLLGMYWGKSMYSVRRSHFPILDRAWHKPFTFVGRHALIFYLAHQVVMALIVGAVCLMAGYRF
ncbi:MAG: DUF1624 domain-containing protein [Clostridiales bacterium]|nr:DUF1624 domain-containing protein [Clostridiales bacterium]